MTATYLAPNSSFQPSLSHGHPLEDSQGNTLDIALEMSMMNLGPGFPAPVNSANDDTSPLNSFFFDMYAHSHRPSDSNVNATDVVQVPSSEHVAEIVGRQGCKIKALRARTNTYIKTPVRGEKPVFVVTGRKEDVNLAKREILAAAEHFTQIRAQRKQAATGNALTRVGSGSPSATGTGPFTPSDEDSHTISVKVPYHVVGLVVGPKGATIKRIQQRTSTYIVTPSRDKEPYFQVTGSNENVEQARKEIEHYIAARTGTIVTSEGVEVSEPLTHPYLSDSSLGKSQLVSDLYLKPGVPDDDIFREPATLTPRNSMYNFMATSNSGGSEKPAPIWSQSPPLSSSQFDTFSCPQSVASSFNSLTASYPGLFTSSNPPLSPSLTKASSAPLLSGENAILSLGSFPTITSSDSAPDSTHLSPIPPIGSKTRCLSLYSESGDSSVPLSACFDMPDKPTPGPCSECNTPPSNVMMALGPCGHVIYCENCADRLFCVYCNKEVQSVLRLRSES